MKCSSFLLLLFISNGLHAQFIIDIANTKGETEYDDVIEHLNKDSALYRVNKVKKAGFYDSDCQCASYYFINRNGLIEKIESGTRKADIRYKNAAIAQINIADSTFRWYAHFDIERINDLISWISVISNQGNYRIGFATRQKGNVLEKTIMLVDSAGKTKSKFIITRTKNGSFEMTEGFHKRKLFKRYYVDQELVFDERYELLPGESAIDTITQSNTKKIPVKNGEWMQSEVYYRQLDKRVDARITLFDTNRLPSKLYIFRLYRNGISNRIGAYHNIYNDHGLLLKEIEGTADADGNIKPENESIYEYEFYE